MIVIETKRLILRTGNDEDIDTYYLINQAPNGAARSCTVEAHTL